MNAALNRSFRSPALLLLGACIASLGLSAAQAQDFHITAASLDAENRPRLEFESDSNSYYVLYRGHMITAVTSPIVLKLGVNADDALVEGDETFRLELSNPSAGAVLGERRRFIVTILDDDRPAGPGRGFNGSVESLAVQPDGRIVAGGFFSQVNGPYRACVARLNPDESLDSTFVPNPGAIWGVRSLALQNDEDNQTSLRWPNRLTGKSSSAACSRNSTARRETIWPGC